MATKRKQIRSNRTSTLSLEGLEPRTVLSGLPISLEFLADSVLTRLSESRLPGFEGSAPIAATEAAGFTVILPSVVPNGLPVRALIMAVGADNRPASFSGEVSLSSSDMAATLPETVTLARGRGYVSVTFNTAGEQTLSVSAGGETPLTGSDSTTVAEPIVATRLVVLMPQSTQADSPTRVTIMALDANGRLVPNFRGELTLTSSDPAATLPDSVSFGRGRATATVTFGTEGQQTLTVKAGELTAEASTTVALQPVVTDFRIEIRPEVVAGEAARVALVAVNADGQAIRDFSGSAILASSDESARLPDTIQFRRGRAYFQVAFTALGEQQITATSGDAKATATTLVKAAPAVASIRIWMPRQLVAGLPAIVQLMAFDADGRVVRGFSGSLDVSSSDAEASLPGRATFVNGIALLQVTFMTVGEQSLSVSDPSNADVTGSASTRVMELRLPWRQPRSPS